MKHLLHSIPSELKVEVLKYWFKVQLEHVQYAVGTQPK